MIRLEQIDHVALRCGSVAVSKEWYVRVLGFEHIHPNHGGGVPIFLRLGSTDFTLFPQKGDEAGTGRIWHYAFRTATYADFESARAELQAQGIACQFRDHDIAHSLYLFDPDGVMLEITTYDLPPTARTDAAN